MSNHPTFVAVKTEKIKIPAGAQDFFSIFLAFFGFLMKFGELRDFSPFLLIGKVVF